MEIIELFGFVAGILVAISSLPQIIKSWKSKSTKDISISWLFINLTGQVLWISYGFLKDSLSLIIMSSVTFLMVISVLILKMRYG